MRAFIALDSPKFFELAERFHNSVDGDLAKGMRFERHPHLTLKFLGEISDNQVAEICKALMNVRFDWPLELKISGLACLPKNSPSRIVLGGIEDSKSRCRQLQAMVEEVCFRFGIPREARQFYPHITLARLKSPRNICGRLPNIEPIDFVVREFSFYESQLAQVGAKHLPMAHFGKK